MSFSDLLKELLSLFKQPTVEIPECKPSFEDERDAYKKLYDDVFAINKGLEMQLSSKEETVDMRMFKDLESLKAHTEKIPSEVIKYQWMGTKNEIPCHYQLRDVNINDFLNFIKDDLKRDIFSFDNVEDVIFSVVQRIHRKFPNSKFYVADKVDKWETPNDALKKYLKGKGDDCDTMGALIYGCLYAIVSTLAPNDLWRLRVAIVQVITGEWHYVVIWAKETLNDWVVIESTWHKFKFIRTWKECLPLRLQVAYEVKWTFNDKLEYRGI